MTATQERTAQSPSADPVATPTIRRVARRARFWILLGAVVAVIVLVGLALSGSRVGGPRLSPSNPAPPGAMALAEVLEREGVIVTEAVSLEAVREAIDQPGDTTLLIYDPDQYLATEQVEKAVALAEEIVLVDPSFQYLRAAAPEVGQAGFVDGVIRADCALPAVEKAGAVSGGGAGFRLVDDSADAELCLGSGDSIYSLIRIERDDGNVTVLGATGALTNEFVTDDGNAALALNLLGASRELVWYLPSYADLVGTEVPTIAELTPRWVNPVIALVALTALAAALWRGRRFGPLIVERLPVVVRASETMLGRARLYEKGSARLRAVDSLRIGAIERIAVSCGLSRLSQVDDVVAAAAAVSHIPLAEVRRILLDGVPTNDRSLVALSDELLELEHSVSAAVRPD